MRCARLLMAACLLCGCGDQESYDPVEAGYLISKDRLWSFMIDDSNPDAYIKKWVKPELRGLMIVDQSRATFHTQFSPLLRQVGDSIGIEIDHCKAIITPSGTIPSAERGCDRGVFDLYFVITDGAWTDGQWNHAQLSVHEEARDLLDELRNQLLTEREGKTCRFATRTEGRYSGEIKVAVALIDSSMPVVLGTCGTYSFLHMLGLYPFDGAQPLDTQREAESMAEFLVKQDPLGATYLLRLLYSPAVKPGMRKSEFVRTLGGDPAMQVGSD